MLASTPTILLKRAQARGYLAYTVLDAAVAAVTLVG